MTDNFYKETFNIAIKELSDLMEQREELDNRREELNARIAKLRDGVLGLSSLAGIDPQSVENQFPHLFPDLIPPDVGLTDAVRKVLQLNDKFLTPVGVRTELKTVGYDIDRYKNILASIHTILKRLAESDEVEVGSIADGTAYKWKKKTKTFVIQSKTGNNPSVAPRLAIPKLTQAPGSSKEGSDDWKKALKKAAESLNTKDEDKK